MCASHVSLTYEPEDSSASFFRFSLSGFLSSLLTLVHFFPPSLPSFLLLPVCLSFCLRLPHPLSIRSHYVMLAGLEIRYLFAFASQVLRLKTWLPRLAKIASIKLIYPSFTFVYVWYLARRIFKIYGCGVSEVHIQPFSILAPYFIFYV